MISWLLYYVFLVTTGVEDLFPPQFLLVGNILMVFMISTVTRKKSLKKCCISTLLNLYSMDGGRSHSVAYPRGGRYGRMRH